MPFILSELMFNLKSISFIPRECNSAAHNLAKEASNNYVDHCWLEELPLSVRSIVLMECSCP
jgi:hypothetical protein